MDSKKLNSLFPTGHLADEKDATDDYFAIPTDQGLFLIAKKDLSSKEQALLALFAPQKAKDNPARNHPWYRILFENEPVELTTPVRIIQIRLRTHGLFMQKEWESEINDMFLQLADTFFISPNDMILIEEKADTNYPVEEIFGLFQALDSDFDLYTQVFVGAFHHETNSLAANFQEEQRIFHSERNANTRTKAFSFTRSAISYFINDAVKANPLMNSLYREWFSDPEMVAILTALWQNQGNVSSAAKELFLHRNTVLYRIDKFQDATRLDLKNMDDLFFCHLLIDVFSEQ
ncbi:helix-turn-helix domain-containing protein [Enterococcus diestrammenae]|uniref:helix-turn-helix domain-containing protein n=1 Tax=Enterococcus diestrammenae TaxID=1155073 RepID=UPI00195AAB0A